jgi:prepilin-type N-terminal cleavage/methylation domain-containing protein
MGMTAWKTQRGFTLIELVITIAIISILTSIAAPAITRLQQRSVMSSATTLVQATIARARIDAMMRGRCVCVMFNSNASGTLTPRSITLRRLRGLDCESVTTACSNTTDWEPFLSNAGAAEPPIVIEETSVNLQLISSPASGDRLSGISNDTTADGRFDMVFRPSGRLWIGTAANATTSRYEVRVNHRSNQSRNLLVCPHGAVRDSSEGC